MKGKEPGAPKIAGASITLRISVAATAGDQEVSMVKLRQGTSERASEASLCRNTAHGA
jgi:hypothetical protein